MNNQLLPRHIQWRRQYDARRYARHLTQAELNTRIRDLLLNFLSLQRDAKIGLRPIESDGPIWMEKLTHMFEEMQLRHGPYPSGFTREMLHSEPFPDFASELAAKAARTMASLGLQAGEVFVKFGKRAHMQKLLETGELRIQSATYFKQMDHNGAVRDDELTLPISAALARDELIKLVRNPQDVPIDAPEQRVDIELRSPTDYWLYCVTTSVEPRLFVDFSVDACVVIQDPTRFRRQLRHRPVPELAGATFREGEAQYIDPLFPTSPHVFVPLVKQFRYTYQREYRFCWIPPSPVSQLTHVDIEIGPISDYSSLIVL